MISIRVVEFYTPDLRLQIGRRLSSTIVELLGTSVPIFLLKNAADSLAMQVSKLPRNVADHSIPVHLDFVVSENERAVATTHTADFQIEDGIQTHVLDHIARLSESFRHNSCLLELSENYDEIGQLGA